MKNPISGSREASASLSNSDEQPETHCSPKTMIVLLTRAARILAGRGRLLEIEPLSLQRILAENPKSERRS